MNTSWMILEWFLNASWMNTNAWKPMFKLKSIVVDLKSNLRNLFDRFQSWDLVHHFNHKSDYFILLSFVLI
jgi:hypothetical protein